MAKIAVVGGRGYTGSELLRCLWQHQQFDVTAIASRSQAGQLVKEQVDGFADPALRFCSYDLGEVLASKADAYVLALPNGESNAWVQVISNTSPESIIVDLSADHRVNNNWTFGLPEINREQIKQATRIANPGCYATAVILALWPFRGVLADTPVAFGVSGYSGAGRISNERNNIADLKDNIRPYKTTGHIHQKEISHVLGSSVYLIPHVTSFFRGLLATVSLRTINAITDPMQNIQDTFGAESYIQITDRPAEPASVRGQAIVEIGCPVRDEENPTHLVVTAALDNLAKGAATQAMQNINLAMGFDEGEGIST